MLAIKAINTIKAIKAIEAILAIKAISHFLAKYLFKAYFIE